MMRAELLFGARRSGRVDANLKRLKTFFEPFHSLPFDDDAAARHGMIRAQMEREGGPSAPTV